MTTPEVAKMIAKRTAALEQTAEELKALQRIVDGVVVCPFCGSRDVVPEKRADYVSAYYMTCFECDYYSEEKQNMVAAVDSWAGNGD